MVETEELVASLNSRGMHALQAGSHDEALQFLTMAKTACATGAPTPGCDSGAGNSRPRLEAVTLNNLGCFYKR